MNKVFYCQSLCFSNKKVYSSIENLIDDYKDYLVKSNNLYSLSQVSNSIHIDINLQLFKSNTGLYYHLAATVYYMIDGKELNDYNTHDIVYIFSVE
jgi:hypothetical protein